MNAAVSDEAAYTLGTLRFGRVVHIQTDTTFAAVLFD